MEIMDGSAKGCILALTRHRAGLHAIETYRRFITRTARPVHQRYIAGERPRSPGPHGKGAFHSPLEPLDFAWGTNSARFRWVKSCRWAAFD